MNKKQHKIILAAIALFNEEGFANVKNQDIAIRAGISLSNLNYNFKTKQDLVVAIFEHMEEVLEEKVYRNNRWILKGKGFDITKSYFEFEQEFQFFYLDTYNLLRTYPILNERVQKQIKQSMQVVKNLNFMAIGMGFLKPEPENQPGLYDHLAKQIWVSNHFHLAQMKIFNETGDPVVKGLKTSCMLLSPYLTEKGLLAYQEMIKQVELEKLEVESDE